MTISIQQALDIVSKCWGKQRGFVYFPWIPGDCETKDERVSSWHESRGFRWPKEKDAIVDHLKEHRDDDVYWCTSIFEVDRGRKQEWAMEHYSLWADLDEVDPRGIADWPPSVAWETSPGRFQALWYLSSTRLNLADRGAECQRLTYHLGADRSGWDITTLLRLPGWANHKPDRRQDDGTAWTGRIVADLDGKGRRWKIDEFDDLPEIEGLGASTPEIAALESEVNKVDRHKAYARYRLKLPAKARELFSARAVAGDRSEKLWWMMRCLADAGASVTEIAAIVRETVWNKFEGRSDELHRLLSEASKAIAQVSTETKEELEEQAEGKPDPTHFFTMLEKAPAPLWLIRNIWTQGSVGFIAGQPKSWKSWMALDMALSVGSGASFMNQFPVELPGPVLYIQEEDSVHLLKSRKDRVWPNKRIDRMEVDAQGRLEWVPAEDNLQPPLINALVREGFVVSDPAWQSWLDEQLDKGYDGEGDYRMLVLDPLMMMAGDVEENRATAMTTHIFKPLKQLAEKHKVAIAVVHHMRKGAADGARGGQMMHGSVANHAFSECSLYVTHDKKKLAVEVENKNAVGGSFKVGNIRNRRWEPALTDIDLRGVEDEEDHAIVNEGIAGKEPQATNGSRDGRGRPFTGGRTLATLRDLGKPATVTEIARAAGVSTQTVSRQMRDMLEREMVTKDGRKFSLNKRPRV